MEPCRPAAVECRSRSPAPRPPSYLARSPHPLAGAFLLRRSSRRWTPTASCRCAALLRRPCFLQNANHPSDAPTGETSHHPSPYLVASDAAPTLLLCLFGFQAPARPLLLLDLPRKS
nr:uncharacterized protein LOC127316429 [Lolium perenne]